jgi:flagella basal body P-ring formation protein FlgA
MILAAFLVAAPAAGQEPVLRVYLPRQITVTASKLSLADVAVVASEDDQASLRAQKIALGRGPHSREGLRIDRALILSRLVAGGFDKSRIRLTGAQAIVVRRREATVSPERIVQAGRTLIAKKVGGEDWQLAAQPKQLTYPAQSDARLGARITEKSARAVQIEVRVEMGGKILARRTLQFHRPVEVRRLLATRDLPAGTPLTAKNIRFETVRTFKNPKDYPAEPFGQMVNRPVKAGQDITAAMLDPIEAKVLVRRNQPVVMKIESPSFVIRAAGVAMQDGKAGDLIQVRNIDSRAVVVARVGFDGTLQPVLQDKETP